MSAEAITALFFLVSVPVGALIVIGALWIEDNC